jgi:hypothetical protein
MSGAPWRRPVIDWQVVLLSTILNVVLLAVLAFPVAIVVTGLVELAHRVDGHVPTLGYGAVWALVYAAGLVRAFMHVELEFSPRR